MLAYFSRSIYDYDGDRGEGFAQAAAIKFMYHLPCAFFFSKGERSLSIEASVLVTFLRKSIISKRN